jgi:hypothetical protein
VGFYVGTDNGYGVRNERVVQMVRKRHEQLSVKKRRERRLPYCGMSTDGKKAIFCVCFSYCRGERQMNDSMLKERRCQPPERWVRPDGTTVACTEKLKILHENWREIHALVQDALDDAVLMGCTVKQVKQEYKRLIDEIECQYREQRQSRRR